MKLKEKQAFKVLDKIKRFYGINNALDDEEAEFVMLELINTEFGDE